jgi:hypothetical protein
MTNEKRFKLDMDFAEALRRFARVDKNEVRDAIDPDPERSERARKRIKEAREEIARGAESGKPKFRL